ncbi:hypothetical protein LCGC14_1138470 [marine sediment metagenome]|uniref:Uncharacterized protein n=1 Tax=marine sediment metagenome TaxID=412755 RepID=A0A0F9MLY1_9ZZZZ
MMAHEYKDNPGELAKSIISDKEESHGMEFPTIRQEGKAKIEDGEITFTWITTLGKPVTETKPLLTPEKIVQVTKARHERFHSMPPGTRESEQARLDRKHVSAHPEKTLRAAWDLMDEDTQMELCMMLDESSHYGISDPKWAKEHQGKASEVMGDDGKAL